MQAWKTFLQYTVFSHWSPGLQGRLSQRITITKCLQNTTDEMPHERIRSFAPRYGSGYEEHWADMPAFHDPSFETAAPNSNDDILLLTLREALNDESKPSQVKWHQVPLMSQMSNTILALLRATLQNTKAWSQRKLNILWALPLPKICQRWLKSHWTTRYASCSKMH